jgi:predicted TPR repeat methyltransferase
LKPLNFSSGDLLADRRADYAEMLVASGDRVAGAELMRAALELAPNWALGWFRLGEMHEAEGALDQAAEAWRTALKLDPADHAGAALRLELTGNAPASAVSASSFVELLFDQYAHTFETSLIGKLDYRVPHLLERAIRARRDRFQNAIDLGCGTGLMGEKLRPISDFLEGYDISAKMLKKAEARGVYDRLKKADLQAVELPTGNADLVAAADVFIYLGSLEGIFAKVMRALRSGGLLAFSVEHHDGPEDFLLRPSRRFAHSEAYLRKLLDRLGFTVLSTERTDIRMDRGVPVEGVIVVATAPGA